MPGCAVALFQRAAHPSGNISRTMREGDEQSPKDSVDVPEDDHLAFCM